MIRVILAFIISLFMGIGSQLQADDIDDCHAAILAEDKTGAMIAAQSISIFRAPPEPERQRLALDCLHHSLSDSFVVAKDIFVSSKQVTAQMDVLSETRRELEELRAIVDGVNASELTAIALDSVEILACLTNDIAVVYSLELDDEGNRTNILSGKTYDAKVFDGKRITLISGDTVTVIDGDQFWAKSGETTFEGGCQSITRQIQNLMVEVDWDNLRD